ncbi:hypothetical protein GH714_028292 [Hevea brasiliensis]|uniref:Coatomer subunit zeta n=1 Tax=Hevea brasiliensis TaxID=3981 RepID=A0A6A6MNT0_HEVBR|nr:hypothetical protein GH714_028292 [Hevea brasiliensis]
MESCPSIKNILLLDSEGKRVAVKYYSDDWPTNNAKEAYEKVVFAKTQRTNARTEAEITMLENNIIVYKFVQDLHFFVTGGEDENELILATVLQGFFDAVGLLLRGNVDKKEALENLDLILLCLDEIVDGGIILETDANLIAGKVASNSMDAGAPLSEQDDPELEAIRQRRMQELMAQRGVGNQQGSEQQKAQDEAKRLLNLKRLGVEDVILRAAQMGQIVEKVSEERLISLLEQINNQTTKQTKVTIQRRRSVLEDDD